MLENNFEFSNMCRVCTKSTMSLFSLYEDDNDGISSVEKLRIICGLEIGENDDYPKTICNVCRKKLTSYYEFRTMCLSSQELITSYTIKQVFIDNFVEANNYDENETEEEIRYYIEVDDDEEMINEDELQLADVEQHIQTKEDQCAASVSVVTKPKTRKTKTKATKKPKQIEYDSTKKHKCKVCKKRFTTELRVKLHMQRIHKQIYLAECKVVCPKCGMKFQQTRNLKRHLVYHNLDSYFGCEFCETKSYSKKSWRKHIKIHDEKINVICQVCNKNILSKLAFIYHMDYHHTKEVLAKKTFYFCHTCQSDFEHFSDLEKHSFENHCLNVPDEHDYLNETFNEVERNVERIFNGSESNNDIKSNSEMYKFGNINASVTFKCNICARFFKNLADLKTHVEECYAKVNRPLSWMCDTCGKRFSASWALRTHQAGHSGARPFVCDTCGQRFKWHNDLTNHKSRIHDRLRPYVCRTCGKTCSTTATLKAHARLHTGEKPFACSVCGKRFAQNASLKEHRLKHQPGQPASCPVCNKVFQTPLRLRTHLKRHNTQRQLFPCDTCGRLFTEKSSVRKHQLKIHSLPVS